jgi:hypothetical protein
MSLTIPQKLDRARAFREMEDVRRQRRPQKAEAAQRQQAIENQQRQRDIDEGQQRLAEKAARLHVVA